MLYHKDIGFPESLDIKEGMVNLWYSAHARERIKGKYKGFLILPSFVKITKTNVIEVSTENNITCDKVLIRTKYDDKKDICIVFLPSTGKVVTLWTNYRNDEHKALNTTKYNKP